MEDIAAAILCIGLCFYEAYRLKNKLEIDIVASLFAILLALKVLL